MDSPRAATTPSSANAPSVTVPLLFILTGLSAFSGGLAWIIAQPEILAAYHYNQHVIAATHLFVLGWICSIVMGVVYQLVPVALETRLHSERMAKWQFLFHLVGFVGMVWMFRVWNMKEVGHYGSALAFGVGLFIYNLARTLRRVPSWNVTASSVVSALFWIAMTVAAGLCVAAAKCSYETAAYGANAVGSMVRGLEWIGGVMGRFDAIGTMHAHAHLGAVGCFTMLIVGVSYKLIPMFTLSEVQSRTRAIASVVLLNIGVAGSFVTILLQSPYKSVFALVTVLALAVYGWELAAILRARKRRALDWGIRYFVTAIALLVPLSFVALLLSLPGLPLTQFTGQIENVYGFIGFLGVVSLAIIGMLYKIIPFLVWFGCYSRQIGRGRVPALSDLYSARLQAAGYWLYLAGLAVVSAGILMSSEPIVRAGGIVLASSAGTLMINVALMLSHFVRPEFSPFPVRPVTVPHAA